VNYAVWNNAHFILYVNKYGVCMTEKYHSVSKHICSLGGRELSRGRLGYIRLCSFGGHSWSEIYEQPQFGRWNQGGVNKPDAGLLPDTTNVPYLSKYKMTFFFHNSSYKKWELLYYKAWNWNMFCV